MLQSTQESRYHSNLDNELLESRMMRKYQVQFGGGRLEKEP
jgi:hypothetical protein